MALYKYMESKWLTVFMESGQLKIGRLFDYQNEEKLGPVIGEVEEGTTTASLAMRAGSRIDLGIDTPEARFMWEHAKQTERAFPHFPPGKFTVVAPEGARIVQKYDSRNLYIYCAARDFDEKAMHQFGYDACLEILYPRSFFSAISAAVKKRARFVGDRPVFYDDRHRDFKQRHALHPALIKPTSYAYQNEWRALWDPLDDFGESLFPDVPAAVKYCRPYVL